MHEGVAQANRAIKLAGVLVRAPGLFLALIVDDHRGVQHHAGGRKTLVERSRINERLEPRTRLAPGLDDPVVFALKEIKAADQGDDRAVFRVDRHQRTLRFGYLYEEQGFGRASHGVDDIPAAQDFRGLRGCPVDFLVG